MPTQHVSHVPDQVLLGWELQEEEAWAVREGLSVTSAMHGGSTAAR